MRNSCCCFGLVLNFTSEAQHAGRRLCGKATGNGEVAKGMSKVPVHSRQAGFLLQPPLLTPSTGRQTAAPGRLASCRKGSLRHTDPFFGSSGPVCVQLGPWHLAGVTLTLRLCLSHSPQPLRFQGGLVNSHWTNWSPSFQHVMALGNVCLSWMHTQVQSLVFTQTLPLHICTTTVRTFHLKLTL